MKNFKLLLATAVVFAVGSAFTANNNIAGEYVLNGDTWELKDGGLCRDEAGSICDYTKVGSATTPEHPNQYENPDNFTPNRMDARYEP
ncbi:DUF6520 family protein [Sphingobacterium sp. DR205]|uniref:DUF6520 family protein n=1 Tax=Sphingobacterium sp. DR205 TaxID=2713573 RepID=UPI0013E4EAFE|nr:DUF6520 family protein [Sphingobacterium sp. DR205]QIH34464.1 hypothetical protein G6053_16905 [Sphingobacterium sp. DR205]